ncbi:Uncharacterized iron-regulated membrane protein [Paracoccus aminovorans]|uniref:Uncharacterized iron-regulated membrane protein n=1 Tax=Paracoccus aminovorans TaxID=34004 RepID=A0A1I3APX4_9RHOB|nr:PepSY-associated TM helix domain-containing protein [Paracoccus aminovorans]CQR84304.1 peptidase [Paracoccus aminovorans]SFH51846.1 Uncharacterized iron-regulated membrane protein [Paracoccus aminovorans]
MKKGFRQSMAWLHTWTGLLLGWLLFAIFLTGTVAYFRSELTYWMRPELHGSGAGPDPAGQALAQLAEIAPQAASWAVTLPDERSPVLALSWTDPGAGQAGGRAVANVAHIDAATGALLHPRETAGGNFLYRFHFELYGLHRTVARWIVGIATMAMFVAIISGVITHKKIFKEFFTFRPRKGQRSWLDMHNMTGVLALPYHVMITFSGLVLFAATLMPLVAQGLGPRAPRPAAEASVAFPPAPPPLASIAPLIARPEAAWSMLVGRILIEKRDLGTPEIVLVPQRNSVVTVHGGSGSNGVERMRFDGRDGRLIEATGRPAASAVTRFGNALGSLHRARFADTGLRWLFFVAGLAGTVMTGSGLLLWVSKRAAKHARADRYPFGLRLVQRLNVGGIAGLALATAGYLWANRLIPAQLPDRPQAEIAAFFSIWLLATLWGFLRPPQESWGAQLGLTAALLLGLPLLGAATGPVSLPQAIWQGDWVLASVELTALFCGLLCAIAALQLRSDPCRKAGSGAIRLAKTGAEG